MDGLLAHPLLVVTGKGGVGKSTVAAALGLAASRRGLRTIVVEVAARDDISRTLSTSEATGAYAERCVGDQWHHISIDPQRATEDYLRRQLPFGALAGLLSRSQIFTSLTTATPGLRERLTVGKVWELAQPDRHNHGAQPYDLLVLDAPATGHGLAMLQAPSRFASVARVRPIAKQGHEIASFLGDPRRTAVVAVSTAKEMPVTETLELRARLGEQLGHDLSLLVVNAVVSHRFSGGDETTLRSAPPSPTRHAALFSAEWARHQRRQIAKLRRNPAERGTRHAAVRVPVSARPSGTGTPLAGLGSVNVTELMASKRICICTGSGGVGKTTTAAAVAIGLAARGQRVAVVTIDPARRLANALGLPELGNEPRLVDPNYFAGQHLELRGELWR